MKMPNVLLSENTRVIVSISTLIIVIGFAITATFTFTTWKTKTENSIAAIELDLDNAKEACVITNNSQDLKIEKLESATVDISVSVKAIETDVKWLRVYMEKNNK